MIATIIQAASLLLDVLAILLLLPAATLLLQVVVAALHGRRVPRELTRTSAAESRPSVTVLIPAHDEALGIVETLRSVQPQLQAGDRLLVVADNCTDSTAEVAREAGAEVIERFDAARRGKGYALDYGVRHLEAAPPRVVVIVDADCTLQEGALDRLSSRCLVSNRPVQALYLMHGPALGSLKSRISEFAWLVRNEVRPLGMERLRLPCQLMGSGMAFPWALLRDAPLATGHLVEDMQLGLDLAAAGSPAEFCHAALVTSAFPTSDASASTQRTRWEHGHLSVIASSGMRTAWAAFRTLDLSLAALVADLCVPPLVSLVMLQGVLLLITAGWAVLTGVWLGALLACIGLFAVGSAIGLSWWRFGRHVVTAKDLLSVPQYILNKLPIYISFLRKKEVEWVRTKRDDTSK